MYKEILHPSFHSLFEVEANKPAIEKQIKEAIGKVEHNLFKAVLLNFTQKANAYLKHKYPLFSGNHFDLDGLTIYFNYKDVFHVYKDDILGDKFALFLEKKNELLTNAENEVKGLLQEANQFEVYMTEKILPALNEEFQGNLLYQHYFKKVTFEYRKKKEEPFVEWKVHTGVKMKEGTGFYMDTTTEQVILDSISVKDLPDEEIIRQAISRVRSLLRNIESFIYGEIRSWVKPNYNLFIRVEDKAINGDPTISYLFKGRYLIVTPAVLSFDEQQKQKLLADYTLFKETTEKLIGIHRRVANEFTWTEEVLNNGYSIEQKKISLGIQSYEIDRFIQEIQNIKDQICLLELSTLKPERDLNLFKRFFVYKVNEYKLGEDTYEVFKIRGKRKIKVRTFKNGVLLSTQQQAKAYRKYMKQQGLSS